MRTTESIPWYWCVEHRLHPGVAPEERGTCSRCDLATRRVALAAAALEESLAGRAEIALSARAPEGAAPSEELAAAREAVSADEAARSLVVKSPSYDAALRGLGARDLVVVALVLARPRMDVTAAAARLGVTRQEFYRAVTRALGAGILLSTPHAYRSGR